MITNHGSRNIVDTIGADRERYTVTSGNLIQLIRQAIKSYKHLLESTVREYVVNARDAMKLNGIDKPIEVIRPTSFKPVLSIRDYAGGLTDSEVQELLFSFGASGEHKRTSDRYVGGFGIGSKSAFNLSDTFLFTVFKNGKKTVWQCMLDKEEYPTAAKLSEAQTDEDDGILVSIPYKPFTNDLAFSTLRWLDVPVTLDGIAIPSYTEQPGLAGVAKGKSGREYAWKILDNSQYREITDQITFVVGCGAIHIGEYDLRHSTGATKPPYIQQKLVVDIPVGCTTLMTSREDFVYDDRTKEVLCEAMKAVADSINSKILEAVGNAKDEADAVEQLVKVREVYGRNGLENLIENSNLVKGKLKPDAMRKLLCRTIPFGWDEENDVESGIEAMYVSAPTRYGRRYGFKYQNFDTTTPQFENKFNINRLEIYRCTDERKAWTTQYSDEFADLIHVSDPERRKIMLGFLSRERSETKDIRKIILESTTFRNLQFRLFPSRTKKFVGLVRKYVKDEHCSEGSKTIISCLGDVRKMREWLEQCMPAGTRIEEVENVEVYKNRKPRHSDKAPRRSNRPRKPVGWIARLVPHKDWKKDTPEDIVEAVLNRNSTVEYGPKTAMINLEGEGYPVPCIEIYDTDSLESTTTTGNVRMEIMRCALAGAACLRDPETGLPVVAVVDKRAFYGEDAKRLSGRVLDPDNFRKKVQPREVSKTFKDQIVMWLYTQFRELGHRDGYHDYVGCAQSTFAISGELQVVRDLAPALKRACTLLKGKRLPKSMRDGLAVLETLYSKPKKFPYIDEAIEFSCTYTYYRYSNDAMFARYHKAVKDVFGNVRVMQALESWSKNHHHFENCTDIAKLGEDIAVLVEHHARKMMKEEKTKPGTQKEEEADVDCA